MKKSEYEHICTCMSMHAHTQTHTQNYCKEKKASGQFTHKVPIGQNMKNIQSHWEPGKYKLKQDTASHSTNCKNWSQSKTITKFENEDAI